MPLMTSLMTAKHRMLVSLTMVAGLIAAATGSEAASGADAAQDVVLDVYSNIGWIAVAVGVGFVVISPLIKRLMHLETLKDDDHVLAGEAELAEPQATGLNTANERKDY